MHRALKEEVKHCLCYLEHPQWVPFRQSPFEKYDTGCSLTKWLMKYHHRKKCMLYSVLLSWQWKDLCFYYTAYKKVQNWNAQRTRFTLLAEYGIYYSLYNHLKIIIVTVCFNLMVDSTIQWPRTDKPNAALDRTFHTFQFEFCSIFFMLGKGGWGD